MNACFIIAVWCARPACASGVHVTFATCCEMSRIGMHIALCARDRTRRWRRTDTHCAVQHYGLSFPVFTRSGVRIRRNLCIREGVRIRTRCVYVLPLA
jgi:hypothetical protein